MYRRGDPRWNRTIQHLASNIESANESAQENLWTFTHNYLSPCFSSIGHCFQQCVAPCMPSREDRLRRNRARSRGRAELSFDFYDDWEEDETDGLLGWGNDELDRLLVGSSNYGGITQPARQRTMSYGAFQNRDARASGGRRKSAVQPHDGGPDPTIIPSSSYFGFLGRLPFKLGGKVLRYKPSAADLTEHPGALRRSQEEGRPLIEEHFEGEPVPVNERKKHGRNRSHTDASGHTTDSLSSRGDLFPSEDEDDAVPLDDEFTINLDRRSTSEADGSGDASSGKQRSVSSRIRNRSPFSNVSREADGKADDVRPKKPPSAISTTDVTLSDLKHEEERVHLEEEMEIGRKRKRAHELALKRGLPIEEDVATSPTSTTPRRSPSATHLTSCHALGERSRSPLRHQPEAEVSDPTDPSELLRFDSSIDPVELPSGTKAAGDKAMPKVAEMGDNRAFVPARLPFFGGLPG